MNDNKQHNQLNEAFALAHEGVEAAALATWQAQGLVNALLLSENSNAEAQVRQSLIEVLCEKLEATHQMLSQLETQMLHQINS